MYDGKIVFHKIVTASMKCLNTLQKEKSSEHKFNDINE